MEKKRALSALMSVIKLGTLETPRHIFICKIRHFAVNHDGGAWVFIHFTGQGELRFAYDN